MIPISRNSNNSLGPNPPRGFSLLEMMVVLVVIGIVVAGVALTVGRGGPDTELRQIVQRFATLGSFASERAVLSGRPVGLMLEPPSWRTDLDEGLEASWRYSWQRVGPGGWEEEPGIDAVDLPPSVQLDVTVEGQMWEWEEAPEVRLPLAVFYPSGEVTSFVIEFRDRRLPDVSQHVETNSWGEVSWREQAPSPEEMNDGF